MRPASPEEFAPAGGLVLPAGFSESLAIDPASGGLALLPDPLGPLLRALSGFRSFDGHLAALRGQGWQEEGDGHLVACLEELRRRGLLVSRSAFLSRMQELVVAESEPREKARVTVSAWLSCGRWEVLERGMASLLQGLRRSGRELSFALLDDSPGGEGREVLGRFARREGIAAVYAGCLEKEAFLGRLQEGGKDSLPGPSLLRLALLGDPVLGWPLGANLNSFLFATAGELALKSDDDLEFRLAAPPSEPEPDDGCVLGGPADPTEIAFYPRRDSLLSALPALEEDWVGWHERFLGLGGPAWVAGLGNAAAALRMDRLSPALLHTLAAGRCRIKMTIPGLYGETAFHGSAYLLSLDGPSREALTSSRQAYESAFRSREIFRGVRRATVGERGFFTGGSFGLDNRGLLPPFFPNLRLEDGVFAQALRAAVPGALMAFLPRAVLHSPDPPRAYTESSLLNVAPCFPELLMQLVGSFRPSLRPADAEAGLVALGRYLAEVGHLSEATFAALAAELWGRAWSGRLQHLEGLLERHRGPDYWARDVETLIGRLKAHIRGPHPTVPADLLEGRTPAEAMSLARELTGRFGELMMGWPRVVERAKELKAEGRGLLVPVG